MSCACIHEYICTCAHVTVYTCTHLHRLSNVHERSSFPLCLSLHAMFALSYPMLGSRMDSYSVDAKACDRIRQCSAYEHRWVGMLCICLCSFSNYLLADLSTTVQTDACTLSLYRVRQYSKRKLGRQAAYWS